MRTNLNPQELVVELLKRSTCSVQCAAVIADKQGVFSWGWNSSGPTGLGQHAEAHAISRANPKRLAGATIYVAARRRKSGSALNSRPCDACQNIIKGCSQVVYRTPFGGTLSWIWEPLL